MESASLTTARVQASRASQTESTGPNPVNLTTAAERHVAAAVEFRNAARDVRDSEALRMLKLLEDHHEQVARLLRSRNARQQQAANGTSNKQETASLEPSDEHQTRSEDSQVASTDTDRRRSREAPTKPNVDISTVSFSQQAPTTAALSPQSQLSASPTAQRRPRREISSSIANNLATARGIRTGAPQRGSSQISAAHHDPPHEAHNSSRTSTTAPSGSPPKGLQKAPGVQTAEQDPTPEQGNTSLGQDTSTGGNEVSFQRFYAKFEGLLSKLSAPLAFAGLPLNPDDGDSPSDAAPSSSKTARAGHLRESSDITKLFSEAAMRAVKEDHPGLSRAVHESFFVVPTSGGSLPYATIARQHSIKHGASSNIDDERQDATYGNKGGSSHQHDDDEFVDARESPESKQPQRLGGKSSPTTATSTFNVAVAKGDKTAEELKLENESLRQLTDTLSRRLYMWEKSAQTQTLTLQQSMLHHSSHSHHHHHHHLGTAASTGSKAQSTDDHSTTRQQDRTSPTSSKTKSNTAQKAKEQGGDGRDGEDSKGEEEKEKARAAAAAAAKRTEELERKLAATTADLDKQARENEKLRTVVLRYRERWEKLKEGARGRRGSATAVPTLSSTPTSTTGAVRASAGSRSNSYSKDVAGLSPSPTINP